MPNIQDILQDWKLGVWSFLIISAGVVVFWGLLSLFNQQRLMQPPKARIVIAGCAFIGFIFFWFFLTELARVSSELKDIHATAIERENRGLRAEILLAGPVVGTNAPPSTNTTVTLQGISSSPQNRTMETGIDMAFVLRIANSGAPTTAWAFKAYIILPDGKEMDAGIPSIVIPLDKDKEIATLSTVVGPYRLTGSRFILDALAFTPLETGAANNYWLMVHVNGLHEVPSGTKFIITFDDVYGRETKVQDLWIPGQ